MLNYHWPGNIRELKNCLDRMTALNSGPLLHFHDLPTTLVNHTRGEPKMAMAAAAGVAGGGFVESGGTQISPLHVVEKLAIKKALDHLNWDRTQVAMRLGIGRTTLYRKIKEYQLDRNQPG
jgi:DNA-binding NtrC family response regulator